VVGYFALSLLKRIIENRKFHMFAYYCWALGVILIVLGFSGY
jgi:undecaprenyl pyrophosphate phosphatase UppP